jgi:biotin carboxyl carrier protein
MMTILSVDGRKFRLGDLTSEGSSWSVLVDEKKVTAEILEQTATATLVRTGSRVLRIAIEKRGERDAYAVELNGRPMVARLEEEMPFVQATGSGAIEGPALVTSPMAGKIASVKTLVGASVEEGQALIVLEAMKMENEIAAPKKGTVKEIYVQQGALAKPGDKLVLVE